MMSHVIVRKQDGLFYGPEGRENSEHGCAEHRTRLAVSPLWYACAFAALPKYLSFRLKDNTVMSVQDPDKCRCSILILLHCPYMGTGVMLFSNSEE